MSENLDIILEIVENADSRFIKITKNSIVVGRDPEQTDITLSEEGASKVHCRIDFKPGHGFSVTDLGSKNGTYINNHTVKHSSFYLDDVIQIGESYIRFAAGQMTLSVCMRLKDPKKAKKMNKSITFVQNISDDNNIPGLSHQRKRNEIPDSED
jgi:pSer/pThr/pTyr-binding forkhead associated (FHA) protein